MKHFFESTKLKILAAVSMVLIGFMVYAATSEEYASLPSQIVAGVLSPFQSAFAAVSDKVTDFTGWFAQANELYEENQQLQEENIELQNQLIEMEQLRAENEQYKEYLGIIDDYEDITLEPAFVIGRDALDSYYSFTVDKGSTDGIELYDTVISSSGVVGIIVEVYTYTSKVMTVLDPSFSMAVLVTQTNDTGIVSGNTDLAGEGFTMLSYLSNDSEAEVGDQVITSGISGLYPADLILGTITSIESESHGKSLYAVIEPAVDVQEIKDVFIITSFTNEEK